MRLLGFLLLLNVFTLNVFAQTSPAVTSRDVMNVYAGPGYAFELKTTLPAGTAFTLTERNPLGNWVRGHWTDDTSLNGWVMTGQVDTTAVQLGDLRVNTRIGDADLPNIDHPSNSDDFRLLHTTPVIPAQIAPAMLEVFQRGQERGSDPQTVAKVGDCNTAAMQFLYPLHDSNYDLGAYGHLQATVDFFAPSFGRDSVAARNGFNVASVFDPFWANPQTCEPNEAPLACEYRQIKPSVAMIMFGQNDILALNREQYETLLRDIIETSLDAGTIPIISTFTNSPENADNWHQVVAFNAITIQVAEDYNVPLVNFWLAARLLPSYGISTDYAHLTNSGGVKIDFANGGEARYGFTLYNLVTLHMLDMVRTQVIEA